MFETGLRAGFIYMEKWESCVIPRNNIKIRDELSFKTRKYNIYKF